MPTCSTPTVHLQYTTPNAPYEQRKEAMMPTFSTPAVHYTHHDMDACCPPSQEGDHDAHRSLIKEHVSDGLVRHLLPPQSIIGHNCTARGGRRAQQLQPSRSAISEEAVAVAAWYEEAVLEAAWDECNQLCVHDA